MTPLEHLTHRSTSGSDDGLSAFLVIRPRLFGIVYRMLRSAADAEDIVQDVWVRWQMADRSLVRDPAAFLVTTATRLAINVRQSARSRREALVGSSLPEPADTRPDPRIGAERRQAVARGISSLLERLTPTERAAYMLREAFDYSYRDIANALRLGEANARQVVTRARQHVVNGRRVAVSSTEQGRLFRRIHRRRREWRRRRTPVDAWRQTASDVREAATYLECANRLGGRCGGTVAGRRCVRTDRSHCRQALLDPAGRLDAQHLLEPRLPRRADRFDFGRCLSVDRQHRIDVVVRAGA
jgi:RNA polymerase sigma factor (sigma-70 family)